MIEDVRLLIPDIDPDDQIYTDAQIEGFLRLAKNNPFRAGSLAVGSLSVDEAITYKVIRTDDQSINGAVVAAEIRKRAQELEFLARRDEELDAEEFFSIVRPQPQHFAPELLPSIWRERFGYC